MKLYTYPITANALKIELLINAGNIALDTEIIDLPQGEHKTSDYLAINPAGKIPLIIDGEYVLAESNAILIYLAQYYKSKLWPSRIDTQAKVMQWLFWQASEWASVAGGFSFQRVLRPAWAGQADEKKLSASQAGFASACMFLSNHLEKQRFLAGDNVSLADISIGAFFIFRKEALMNIEPFEGLNRWLEELESQKWWQKTQSNADLFLNQIHVYTSK
jgi:glutathione S-transferase